MSNITLAELLEAGVHFGHQARRWNPKMFSFIYRERNRIHIIDLVQTASLLTEASEYARQEASKGKKFLFVGTKRQAGGIIAQEAQRCNSYYVNHRWLGGMLTNWNTIKTRIERLKELEHKEMNGEFELMPKKEASRVKKELEKLRLHLNGIKYMESLPDIVIVVDQKREMTAVQECLKLNIPIISLLDTNCDPELSDVFIPANDDAIRSIQLIIGKLTDAIEEGNLNHNENINESQITTT